MSVSGYTSKFGLNLIDFDSNPWHTDDWANLNAIDALLYSAMTLKYPMYIAASAVANTLTMTIPTVTVLADMKSAPFSFIAPIANSGAVTLNVNGLGAVEIRQNNSSLTSGQMVVNQVYFIVYDGTVFRLLGRSGELTAADVRAALGYTPANKAGETFTGDIIAVKGSFSGQLKGKGTVIADSAAAGEIGEFMSATLLEPAKIGLTNNTPANVISLALTAGDWDVSGVINFVGSGAATEFFQAGINIVSATMPAVPDMGFTQSISSSSGLVPFLAVGPKIVNIAVPTTVYLIANAVFAAGTTNAYGIIRARRMR